MAHIVEFEIEALAGKKTYAEKLNEDVNVFFGVNGSGKTTLLRILHAALAADTKALKNLPFRTAAVKIYFGLHRASFVRRISQSKRVEDTAPVIDTGSATGPTSAARSISAFQTLDHWWLSTSSSRDEPSWESTPPEPDGIKPWRHGYMPISRLYSGLTPRGRVGQKLSEDELNEAFAASIKALWSGYYTDIAQSVQKIQEKGLADVLKAILSAAYDQTDVTLGDAKNAYLTVSQFFGRQPGFADVLGSETWFEREYSQNRQLRTVVPIIEGVEKKIQAINAPREQLRQLVNEMFTRKQVSFSEKDILIRGADDTSIALPALSSGEKQFLLLALEALSTGMHPLLIDEPELSMHVDWQSMFVRALRALNPDMQLIIATHSPEIMAELPDEQIFRICPD